MNTAAGVSSASPSYTDDKSVAMSNDASEQDIATFNEDYNKESTPSSSSTFDVVVDDAAGTLFTVTADDGREIVVATDDENRLIIDGKATEEVDDDKLTFSTENGELTVLRDGKALEGYTPIKLQDASVDYKLDDIKQNSQTGSIMLFDSAIGPSAFYDSITPRENDGGFGSTEIVADVEAVEGVSGIALTEGGMSFTDFLSQSLETGVNGLEKQKFQYGGYDSSEVTTLNTWKDVLETGAVQENGDGSVTLTTSGDVPRVQFYPDDDVEGGRQSTKIEELRDVAFDMDITGYTEGDAAWIYELHKMGDGQAMAIGFNQEGNLMLANGNTTETEISLVDAGGVAIDYQGSTANVTVLNKDGSYRDEASIEISGSEVHVKGIELYNRRAAADTNVSATYNNIRVGDLNS